MASGQIILKTESDIAGILEAAGVVERVLVDAKSTLGQLLGEPEDA